MRQRLPVPMTLLAAALTAGITVPTHAQDASNYQQDAWAAIPDTDLKQVEALAADYKQFLRKARHELQVVVEAERLLRDQGFRPLDSFTALKPGDKFYVTNRDRALIAAIVGREPLDQGSNLAAAHIDAPRIELKANPVYASEGFALFQTNYHGGIKNYQWANIPLALVGRVTHKNGTSTDIAVGLDGEPWLVIPDLAPHEDRDYRDRTQRDVIMSEELDPVVGSRAGADGVDQAVTTILEQEYGIAPEDFVSAQLALVPALPVGDVGLDRALIGGYAHDDLLCSFVALRSLLDAPAPRRTAMVFLAANEETGSQNVMGARSTFFGDTVLEILEKQRGRTVSLSEHRNAMNAVLCISDDTTTGIHPTFPGTQEKTNAARVGGGVVIKRYGRGNDPVTEALARVRMLLDQAGIPWQTHTYKVGTGGGGTLGMFFADDGMDVVDIGAAILAMHSTWSLASKADLWWLYRFHGALWAAE